MGKVITSPVLEFPGTVTLNDKPTMPMVEAFMDAKFMYMVPGTQQMPIIENGKFVYLEDGETIKTRPVRVQVDIENITPEQVRERRELRFASALPLIEAWNIEGQPKEVKSREDLNPKPYVGASNLIKWLLSEIFDYCMGEREVPKE